MGIFSFVPVTECLCGSVENVYRCLPVCLTDKDTYRCTSNNSFKQEIMLIQSEYVQMHEFVGHFLPLN